MSVFQITGFDLSRVIGDLGDSRFILAITEYNYQWATGHYDNYWDGFFFYPEPEVISYSDNLLGILPLYFPVRILIGDMHYAFQVLLILVHILNYFSAYLTFRKLSGNTTAAAIGAFIFAFSMSLNGIHNHPQFLFRFCVPVFMLYLHRYLSGQSLKDLMFTFALLAYQIYLGAYLGVFLLLLGGAYTFVYVAFHYRSMNAFLNAGKHAIICGLLLMIALLPLLFFYYNRVKTTGFYSPYAYYMQTLPRPSSYFKSFPGTAVWSSLISTDARSDYSWLHFLFPGIFALIAVAYAIYLSIKGDRVALISVTTLLLIIVFTTNYEGHTLYGYLMKIPGVKTARVVSRIITVELFLFGWLVCFMLRSILLKKENLAIWLGPVIALLVVADNFCTNVGFKTYSIHESNQRIELIEQKLNALPVNENSRSFAYLVGRRDTIQYYHLDAMLCALKVGSKTVNGYSSSCHKAYGPFWTQPDSLSLAKWCKAMNTDPGSITIVK